MNLSLALNFRLPDSTTAPSELLLIPAGNFSGRDKRSWQNPTPQSVIARTIAEGSDVVIDVEHSTHIKGEKGEEAPARGWVKPQDLEVREGAIWATHIDWNEKGESLVLNREYRYYSPAFKFTAAGVVTLICSVGLTNKPNLPQTTALNRTEETRMNKLLLLMGLAATATEDDAIAAYSKLTADHGTALNRAQAAVPDIKKFIPVETHQLALNRAESAESKLATHATEQLEQKAIALVDGVIEEGKCAPANRDHYLALCRQEGGLKQVGELFAAAPKVMPSEQNPKEEIASTSSLSVDELAVCRMMGHTEAEFISARDSKN